MQESKLFKNLWRFNAIVIAIVGLLAIAVLLFSAFMLYSENNRNRHRNKIVNIDPETDIQEKFRLGLIKRIRGSNSVIIPLYSDREFSLRYSGSKSTATTRNILFSNMRTQENHWLFPNNAYLIYEHNLIKEDNSNNSEKDIATIMYTIIKKDSNGDNKLTANDLVSVAFTDPEGKNYTEPLQDIENVLGYEIMANNAIAIIFNRDGQAYTVYLDLKTLKVTKQVPLPKIKFSDSINPNVDKK